MGTGKEKGITRKIYRKNGRMTQPEQAFSSDDARSIKSS
jgi:hypothetical protein